MTRKDKHVVLHGHFYQPPREDPWTGRIERQGSADPDHDWNARVLRECYAPNARAKVLGPMGDVAAVVNNYEFISFNFGPTLLSWLESADAATYDSLIHADRASAKRLNGHGNAIAQAYSHMILPLADPLDQETQIVWGLADFRRRFGREPEAMWLPETAADDAVLARLADHGMKYALLAPGQAARIRPRDGAPAWQDVGDGSIRTGRFYRWTDGHAREIALFFYDGGLSHEASFGDLLVDARRAAEALAGHMREDLLYPSLVNDGETYGHHKKFAEMCLARLFYAELPKRGIAPVNLGWTLEREGAPRWDVEIKKGPQRLGTAWSCAHGVGRWMEDCGCGTEPGGGKWRAPLRESLEWLRDRLRFLTDAVGGSLYKDVWAARDAYIEVILDPEAEAAFLDAHAKRRLSHEERARALDLMELQKLAMYMFTSCGWFFANVDGIEATQNLKYAAKAVETARRLGLNAEEELIARLKLAGADRVYKAAAVRAPLSS